MITFQANSKFTEYDHILCLKAILPAIFKQTSSEFQALPVYEPAKEGEKRNPTQKEVHEFEEAGVDRSRKIDPMIPPPSQRKVHPGKSFYWVIKRSGGPRSPRRKVDPVVPPPLPPESPSESEEE